MNINYNTEKEHYLMNMIQNRKLGSSTPLIANEGIVEVIVDHEQLLNEPFVHQLGDELHHSSLHALTHRVQLLLGHMRRERDEFILIANDTDERKINSNQELFHHQMQFNFSVH